MKIIIDTYIPYIHGALESVAEVVYLPYQQITPEVVKDADALIVRTRTQCNASLLDGSRVKFIASATIGYDHIDAAYCKANNITWTNAPGCNALSVAQYIASVLCMVCERNHYCLRQKTIGIIGVGAVGSKIAKLAEGFGMKVLLNDPPRADKEGSEGFASIEQIYEEADFITFHTLLSKDGPHPTYHLANDDFFQSLKKKPVIINAARGEVIRTASLLMAMDKELVSEVVLDCWENEPHIHSELLMRTLIATPHIAGYSADGKGNAAMQSVQSVSKFFGLGLNNWQVPEIPEPMEIDFSLEMSAEEFFLETYEVEADSLRLKLSPDTFERQRSHYPFRREPSAYLNMMNDKLKAEFLQKFPVFIDKN